MISRGCRLWPEVGRDYRVGFVARQISLVVFHFWARLLAGLFVWEPSQTIFCSWEVLETEQHGQVRQLSRLPSQVRLQAMLHDLMRSLSGFPAWTRP